MPVPRLALLALASTALASCASTPPPVGTAADIRVAEFNQLPKPATDASALVHPGDKIQISVLGFEDLSRELLVGPTGEFQFPLIGLIQAAGRNPFDIAQQIEAELAGDYVVNPVVTVDILEQSGRLYTVGGQVEKPGRYDLVGPMTLLEAVATSGGTTETANLADVVILRTIDGQRYVGAYNLGAIQRGNYEDPEIFVGDIIQVGDSPALRRIKRIATLSPLITTPIILIERLLR
ncbi:polysaccharide biosynthesis/export family protein [Sphingomicrobium astaxanthinifaciens]|uniref:polysaccharide biosynthesis/export family protein n=1 Tax=Sphingomicrobium astaxanthinifaciens TaxID=1227949 RepID=UPI001FCBC1F6|nr:polysaccharide biosynthesis/export family protein [Sphingomicrobium astaxanthinifaciens]MCJ7420419.1 polysaccharide export protein [Sphingomicrobium astaxanthinifaciens]